MKPELKLVLATLIFFCYSVSAHADQMQDATTVMVAPPAGAMTTIVPEPQALKQPTCTFKATSLTRAFPLIGPYNYTVIGSVSLLTADPAKWDIQHVDYVLARLAGEVDLTGIKLPDARTVQIDCPLNGVILTVKVTTAQ